MKLTSFKLKDLFFQNKDLTFLVGAGCSVDAPSCLPAGRAMMDAMIEYTCVESEIEKIEKLEELRFEALVEILRDTIDEKLNFLDFYDLCKKPNIQHYFLGEMIKKGYFVLTTNFDCLIEYALLNLGIRKNNLIPVITKADFLKFSDPYEQLKKKKKILYKIHGSTRNVNTGKLTKKSLIATIEAFGLNKEGQSLFQLESFKQPAFLKLTKKRTLIVMGYSGSDDFDIIPTLITLKDVRSIIWVNFSKGTQIGNEEIFEIDNTTTESLDNMDKKQKKIAQILLEMLGKTNVYHVYLVDVNTTSMVKDLLDYVPKKEENFKVDPSIWFNTNIKTPNKFEKCLIPYLIYHTFEKHEDALRCLEKLLRLAEEEGNLNWKALAYSKIGNIYNTKGNQEEALKYYESALQIQISAKALKGNLIDTLNYLGNFHFKRGYYDKAEEYYRKAYEINKEIGNLKDEGKLLINIGEIHIKTGKIYRAAISFEEALKIADKLGNMEIKIKSLNYIGQIYQIHKNYLSALKYYEEAHQILIQLGLSQSLSAREISQKIKDVNLLKTTQKNQQYPDYFQDVKLVDDSDIKEILKTHRINLKDVVTWIEEAKNINDRGKLRKLLLFIRQFAKIYPHNHRGWYFLGVIHLYLEDLMQAKAVMRLVVELDPENLGAWLLLGQILSDEGEYVKAKEVYTNLVNLKPKMASNWTLLGLCLYQLKDYDSAKTVLSKAVKLNRKEGGAWLGLSYIYRNNSELNKALKSEKLAKKYIKDKKFKEKIFYL